jgi:ABC-type transporter Mla subunit MlaD
VFRTTASRDRALTAIVRALPPFLDQLRSTSRVISAASPNLNAASTALAALAPTVAPALLDIDRDLPSLQRLFAATPAATAAGRAGLPALTQILETIPVAFRQLYPTARQLIPLFQLFATYREAGLVAPLANAGSSIEGTFVGPEGKIISRIGGAVFSSNESVGGWVKRLPTNRANPYPTPTGLSELSKIGFLKSYDCRNIHNVDYLPPLGSGVPPCLTQGPWTYRGKHAYYPRLQEASP